MLNSRRSRLGHATCGGNSTTTSKETGRKASPLGEYVYDDHGWTDASDSDGETRRAIRFRLDPVDDDVFLGVDAIREASEQELFVGARGEPPTDRSTPSSPDGERTYPQPELLGGFTLRSADGVCQGCGEDVRFRNADGDRLLEVHHLYRRIDGGANTPENVIALCTDCHRRRHREDDANAFNQTLIETAENRNERLRRAVEHNPTG